MKQFFLLVFLMFFGISSAQFSDRKEIAGNIRVPAGAEAEGITVFNKDSGHGTVSSESGDFSLFVQAGDSIYFSAVQYGELLVVVDEEVVTTGKLHVEINEGINQLQEVIVRPHKLTGNIKTDAESIEVVKISIPPMSFNFNDYEMRPDFHSGAINATEKEGLKKGANILGILGEIVNLVVPKKVNQSKKAPEIGLIELERKLRASYDNAFFTENFRLSSVEISDFIAYMAEQGFPGELLQDGKELDLLQYLMVESNDFIRLSR